MKILTKRKKRAVSEIIGTLMILMITVAGAVFIANAMKSFDFPLDYSSDTSELSPHSVRLIGYDTRDSVNLSDVTELNNDFDQVLCTNSCSSEVNHRPYAGGTEFLVLHIHNAGINPIYLHNILINNEGHSWDAVTANTVLNVGVDEALNGEFPTDGKFSIIPINNGTGSSVTQLETNTVQPDEQVRVVLKLSSNIPQDIGMWDSLRILVNYGGVQPAEFFVLSGDAKW